MQRWCKETEVRTEKKKKKRKSEELGTFYDGKSLTVKLDLCGRSTGRQRERNFITVLGTKNAGKNEISEYLFFSFISYLLIIHHLHLCVCVCVFLLYKRLQNEKRV